VVVTHHRATNLNRNTLHLQAKKMIGLEHTISEFLRIASPFHQSRPTTPNTPNRTDTLPTHERTNKIRTDLHQDPTETTERTSRIMVEEVHSIWLSASPHPDKERQLHADIAEDAR